MRKGWSVVRGLMVAAVMLSPGLIRAAEPGPEQPAADPDPATAAAPRAGAILWRQQFGTTASEGVARLATDSAGNVLALGTTAGTMSGTRAGGTDVFLAKFNAAGTQLWVRQTGVAQNDKALALAVNAVGEAIIAGSVASQPPQWFLAKYSSAGAPLWKRTFTTAAPADIALTGTGQIVTVTAAGDYLEQYSATGTLQWRRSIADAQLSSACCVAIDADGNILVGGTFGSIYINAVKFSPAGVLSWHQAIQWFHAFRVTGLAVDTAGNVIVAAYGSATSYSGGSYNYDLVAKWSPAGSHPIGDIEQPLTCEVDTNWPGSTSGVAADAAGNIFLAGSAALYSQSGSDAVVTATGAECEELWRVIHGTAGTDYANDIAVGPGGVLYVGGWTNGAFTGTAKGGGDAYILKLSPQ